jgi:putative tryptophan/tyrosine transport system substrate-binding protein
LSWPTPIDPVGIGVVASLARPGGNITGLASSSDDSSPKQLELLAAVVPNASRIGFLGNPNSPSYSSVLKTAQSAAKRGGLSLLPIGARSPQEIEDAFVALARERVPAAMFVGDAVLYQQQHRIAELALANRLATMFSQREYVVAGGLMTTVRTLRISTIAPRSSSTRFSRAQSQATCRLSSRRNSTW